MTSRSFTSSDPVAISEFVRAKAVSGTDTQAESVEAMRASLEQALVALSDLRCDNADLRADVARGWGRAGLLELRAEVGRQAELATSETLEAVLRLFVERRVR